MLCVLFVCHCVLQGRGLQEGRIGGATGRSRSVRIMLGGVRGGG